MAPGTQDVLNERWLFIPQGPHGHPYTSPQGKAHLNTQLRTGAFPLREPLGQGTSREGLGLVMPGHCCASWWVSAGGCAGRGIAKVSVWEDMDGSQQQPLILLSGSPEIKAGWLLSLSSGLLH